MTAIKSSKNKKKKKKMFAKSYTDISRCMRVRKLPR